jgi:uncharacterized protein (DUF983 family)
METLPEPAPALDPAEDLDPELAALEPRPLWRGMVRGFFGRCPHCGKGRLFRAFLKPVAQCKVCGEDYSHQRADDAPPYFTMVIVGHILVPIILTVQFTTNLTVYQHLALWLPLTLILTVGLLQPVKGAIIALQWALRMHGFDGLEDDDNPDGQFLPPILPPDTGLAIK